MLSSVKATVRMSIDLCSFVVKRVSKHQAEQFSTKDMKIIRVKALRLPPNRDSRCPPNTCEVINKPRPLPANQNDKETASSLSYVPDLTNSYSFLYGWKIWNQAWHLI